MAKTQILIGNGGTGIAMTAGSTSYTAPLFVFETAAETSQTNAQVTYRVSGTFSEYSVSVSANATDTNSFVRIQINGSNGNGVVTIPGDTTGEFIDFTNTDSISVGDEVNFVKAIGSPGNSAYRVLSYAFTSDSNTVIRQGASNSAGSGFSSASTTNYYKINSLAAGATESLASANFGDSFTLQNFGGNVSANARTTDTVFRIRKNGGNGNGILTYGSGVTGILTNTSDTDSFVDGDLGNYSITTSTGTQTITIQSLSFESVSTDSKLMTFNSSTVSFGSTATTDFFAVGGSNLQDASTEANVVTDARFDSVFSKLWIYFSSNTFNGSTAFVLRNNGSDTALSVTIPAGTTGEFIDTTNTASFVEGDAMSLRLTESSSSGSAQPETISILWENTEGGGDQFLLQENGGLILQENGRGLLIQS